MPDSPASLFGAFAGAAVVGQAAADLDVLGKHAGPQQWLYWKGLTNDTELGLPGFGQREGVVWRVEVSPGSIAFRRKDYGRLRATAERAHAADLEDLRKRDFFAALTERVMAGREPARRTFIRSWSAKSRANMVAKLATLDYAPMIEQGSPAMVTLTYPGDWLAVAPSAAVCAEHVRKLKLRFQRRWGVPMVGVWKREFQRRGAPHYHLLMVPPAGRLFDEWLARTWASIVDATSCGSNQVEWGDAAECCERHRHEAAHLTPQTVDRREGSRFTDPRRVGVYFSKHGSFSAKDYQNDAPAEWLADETAGIGRFWGVWGLRPAVAVVEVQEDVSNRVRRAASRWQAATDLRDNAGRPATVKRAVWRKKYKIDHRTGEILGWRWVKRNTTSRLRPRLTARSGFMAVNDGPALAMRLGDYADLLVSDESSRRRRTEGRKSPNGPAG